MRVRCLTADFAKGNKILLNMILSPDYETNDVLSMFCRVLSMYYGVCLSIFGGW